MEYEHLTEGMASFVRWRVPQKLIVESGTLETKLIKFSLSGDTHLAVRAKWLCTYITDGLEKVGDYYIAKPDSKELVVLLERLLYQILQKSRTHSVLCFTLVYTRTLKNRDYWSEMQRNACYFTQKISMCWWCQANLVVAFCILKLPVRNGNMQHRRWGDQISGVLSRQRREAVRKKERKIVVFFFLSRWYSVFCVCPAVRLVPYWASTALK